jgi:hypothetical protein
MNHIPALLEIQTVAQIRLDELNNELSILIAEQDEIARMLADLRHEIEEN